MNELCRLIAFYLPQFHPIPENDAWWGPGFTEWRNVTRAQPQFPGHYQPHRPADLGYYDLRVPEVRQQQADLAREHGIHGFCYYYYWFAGRRLLERPLNDVLSSGKPDFPFCVCWANENWTRRWDGADHQVLMQQEHSQELDRKLIRDLVPVFKDPRYIRVDGAPLFLVYRADILPDVRETVDQWRKTAAAEGIGPLHLAAVQTFGLDDPRKFGFDSAVEFPPHNSVAPNIRAKVLPQPSGFSGTIIDYRRAMSDSLQKVQADYRLFRGVMVAWDNTARRGERSTIFVNSSPAAYEAWLRAAIKKTCLDNGSGERLVFINAWNEWAEGAHLEPDEEYGHEYLLATRRAVATGSMWKPLLEILQGEHASAAQRRQAASQLEAIVDAYDDASNDIMATTSADLAYPSTDGPWVKLHSWLMRTTPLPAKKVWRKLILGPYRDAAARLEH